MEECLATVVAKRDEVKGTIEALGELQATLRTKLEDMPSELEAYMLTVGPSSQ